MIYFDNAATTFPKPEEVYKALDFANRNLAFNAGRGEYKESTEAFNMIDDTREKLASLINATKDTVVFTSSATESLNLIINGLDIKDGDYIYVSPFEHNAVIRPLKNLQKTIRFELKVLKFNKDTWEPEYEEIENEFALYHPKAIFISHLSNVTGYLIPYERIFELSDKWNSINVLDCSQSLGVINPKDISKTNYIVFAGHKSLYASFGIAGFYKLKNDDLKVVKTGGTGSDSLNPEMPKKQPYKYEAGSPNIVGIAGLNASVDWLENHDVFSKESKLMDYLVNELKKIDFIKLYCPGNITPISVLSINIDGMQSDDVAVILSEDFDICVRAGYHCAPLVHDFINSREYAGTIRISLNYFDRKSNIDELLSALKDVLGL